MTWHRPHSKLHHTSHRSPDSSPQSQIVRWFKSKYPILSQGEIEFLGDREIGGFLLPDGTVAQLNHAGEHAIAAEKALVAASIRSDHAFVELSNHGIFRVLGDAYEMNLDVGPHITQDQLQTIRALTKDRHFFWTLTDGRYGETYSSLITALGPTA